MKKNLIKIKTFVSCFKLDRRNKLSICYELSCVCFSFVYVELVRIFVLFNTRYYGLSSWISKLQL